MSETTGISWTENDLNWFVRVGPTGASVEFDIDTRKWIATTFVNDDPEAVTSHMFADEAREACEERLRAAGYSIQEVT